MNLTRATILAAVVAALGLTAIAPAFAGQQQPRPGDGDRRTLEFRRDGGGGGFRFVDVSCNPRAADRLERRLERMAERLDLTAEQQKLFEDFRIAALTAQTDFADNCPAPARQSATPDRQPAPADKSDRKSDRAGRPDLIQRLERRLELDEARLAAFAGVLPPFKAFYQSLSDEQKSGLMSRKGFRPGSDAPRGRHFHRPGPDR